MANETSKLFGDNRPNSIHSNGPTFYFLDKDNVSVSGSTCSSIVFLLLLIFNNPSGGKEG